MSRPGHVLVEPRHFENLEANRWVQYPIPTGLVGIRKDELERIYTLAGQDPSRREGEGVWIPVSWLVGERVGY